MTFSVEYAKSHWKVLLGAFVGVLLLYYIYRSAGRAAAPAASTDLSAGSYQLQGLNAAGAMQAAQINAGIETAQLQSQVASHGIDAQLTSNLAMTQAQLAAAQAKTAGEIVTTLDAHATAVQMQHIVSDTALAQTKVQADTLKALAVTAGQTQVQVQQAKNVVAQASIKSVNDQIMYAITHDTGHLASFLQSFAPVVAAETGQGGAAVGLANANTARAIGTSPGTQISQIGSGIGSVLNGLFG